MESMVVDKRRARRSRHPGAGLVTVFVQHANGKREAIGSSLLYDISRTGVGITMDIRIRPGTALRLVNRYVDFEGIVRVCTSMEVGYKLGIEFTLVTRGILSFPETRRVR